MFAKLTIVTCIFAVSLAQLEASTVQVYRTNTLGLMISGEDNFAGFGIAIQLLGFRAVNANGLSGEFYYDNGDEQAKAISVKLIDVDDDQNAALERLQLLINAAKIVGEQAPNEYDVRVDSIEVDQNADLPANLARVVETNGYLGLIYKNGDVKWKPTDSLAEDERDYLSLVNNPWSKV